MPSNITPKQGETYVQCRLRNVATGAVTTCWLNKHHKFSEGSVVTLKGSDEEWEVVRKYSTVLPKSQLRIDWKVGGLS